MLDKKFFLDRAAELREILNSRKPKQFLTVAEREQIYMMEKTLNLNLVLSRILFEDKKKEIK